jgi:cellulase (glycosyl hydrolase family 5)
MRIHALAVCALVGCGGADDPVNPVAVRSALAGICDDPHWLTNGFELTPDGKLKNKTTLGGYATAGDIKALGPSRIRFTLNTSVPDKSTMTLEDIYKMYDAAIADYTTGSVQVLLVLNFETTPMPPGATPASLIADGVWTAYADQFAARASEIATRYGKQIEAYEIMNEWNGTEASPTIPPDAYGELLARTRAAMPAGVVLVTGGLFLGGPDLGTTADDLAAMLAAVPDLAINANAVAVHPYGAWPGDDSWAAAPTVGAYPMYSAVLDSFAPLGLPIWITEWNIADGTLGASSDEQAAQKKRLFEGFFRIVAADDRVDHAYFFAYSDANDGKPGFGLVDGPGRDKPYLANYRSWLSNKRGY